MKDKYNHIIKQLFFTTSFIAIYLSSIEKQPFLSLAVATANISFLIGFIYLIREKAKISIPKNYLYVVIFTIILFIYAFLLENRTQPLKFALTFEIGLAYWLLFYNIEKAQQAVKLILLLVPLAATILRNNSSLFFVDYTSANNRHYFIGDIWSFYLVLLITDNYNFKNLSSVLLTITGFIVLIIANVRSSYVSLISGVMYLNSRLVNKSKNLSLILAAVIVVSVIFLFSSSLNKSILSSRPYYLQSMMAFKDNPLGVGMGNFSKISQKYTIESGNEYIFSTKTHNIYLEALSGVGIFSIFFLMFIFKTFLEILRYKGQNLVWAAVFIAITINLMFDAVYIIPGVVWMWFIVYAMFQKDQSRPA